MPFLTQEIVDYLNQTGDHGLGEWLQQTPVVLNFVTCPYISIRPTTIPLARRIMVFEGLGGRFVDIHYRDGSHRYIIDVARWGLTVEQVEALIHQVDMVKGECHVERHYLIILIPAGYRLDWAGQGKAGAIQLRYYDRAIIESTD